jgi:hypothetical protein
MLINSSVIRATALAVFFTVMCEGAAPSLSVVNLPAISATVESISAMTADTQGNIYLTGTTISSLPVTPGAAQVQPGGGMCEYYQNALPTPCSDAFVAKIRAATGDVVYAAYWAEIRTMAAPVLPSIRLEMYTLPDSRTATFLPPLIRTCLVPAPVCLSPS